MKPLTLCSLLFVFLTPAVARAEAIVFDISTDLISYTVGDTVNWSVSLGVSESTSLSNFGLENATLNLRDSLGESLSAGTINNDSFPSYFQSGGTYDPAIQTLRELTASSFFQAGAVLAHQSDTSLLLQIPFASGSYVATQAGNHTLLGSPGSVNTHFDAAGAFSGSGVAYSVSINHANFSVTAVPEPSSIGLLILASVLVGSRQRSNRNCSSRMFN